MSKLCDAALCNGCSACAAICPRQCIQMVADSEGFLRPVVGEKDCVQCGLCARTCPVLTPPAVEDYEPQLLAAVNSNEEDRLSASSGGVFILLAQWVLDHDGVVFGAAFQEDFSVAHSSAQSRPEVLKFCGSKYVQSRVGTTFREAKTLLEQGRYVLFTGTPCQILGLHSFLRKDYPTLITADIVCHGSPAPAVWQRYLSQRAKLDDKGALRSVNFRCKDAGWTGYLTHFEYENGVYSVPHGEDPYMRGFLKELYLRPSCYQCSSKGLQRVSDLTLGDLWGASNVCPSLHDNKGTSLVLLHSKKAAQIWADIEKHLTCTAVDSRAVSYNPAIIRSMTPHPARERFFHRFHKGANLIPLILKLTQTPPPSLYRKVRSKLGRLIRRKP